MSYCFFFTKLKIRKEKKRDRRIRSENKKDLDNKRETKKTSLLLSQTSFNLYLYN